MRSILLLRIFTGVFLILVSLFSLPGNVYASQRGGYEIFIDGFASEHVSEGSVSGFFYGRWLSMDRAALSPTITIIMDGAVHKGTADFTRDGLDLMENFVRKDAPVPDIGAGTWKSEKITVPRGVVIVSSIAAWGGAGAPTATDTRGIDISASLDKKVRIEAHLGKTSGILVENLEFVKLISGRDPRGGNSGYFHVYDEHSMMKHFSHTLKKQGKIARARHTRSGRELYIQVFSPLMTSAGFSIDISSVSMKRHLGDTSAVMEFFSEVRAPEKGMVTASVMESRYLLFAVGIPEEVTDISFEGRMSVEGRGGKRIEMSIPLMTDFRDAPASSL